MKWLILMWFCALMSLGKAIRKYDFTAETASQCQETFIEDTNTNYKYFGDIYSKDRRQYKLAPNTQIEMHFAITSPKFRYLWIKLTNDPKTNKGIEEGYQFGMYLKQTVLKNTNHTVLVKVNKQLSSFTELTPIYIRLGKDGLIEMGIECEEPFITYLDKRNPVNMLSKIHYSGEQVRWLHDCPVNECLESPVIKDSETYLTKREGSTVDLPCRIQISKPAPSITWFFMKKGTKNYVQMRNETGEVLRLTKVLRDNEGYYKCEAKNTLGSAAHTVQLEVEESPVIEDTDPYLKKIEGSTVDIPCRIQKGNPKPSIEWFFMKKGTKGYVQMQGKTGDVLRLTNVLADNEGHYKCEAKNTVGRDEHIVQLEVEETPIIKDSESYLKKIVGSNVDIPCRIQKGKPEPNIEWFFMKKGTKGYVQMRNETGDVLHLTNVLADNEGNYKCEAKNTAGRAEHIVQLEVEESPVIEDSDPYLKKIEGSTVDIPCRIQKGIPEPSIAWFFMKKGTKGYVQMRNETGDVLHLTKVLRDNEGHYKCEAKNTAGSAEHIVQLEVEESPVIEDSEPYLKKIEGSTVDIPCRIQKGNPKPSITWFFMKKGTKGYVQMRNETGDVLRLTNVLADNEGHYKCEANNTVGRDEHIVQLEVEESPIIKDSEPYLKKIVGSTVNIPCRIQKGKPEPSITWFFMKKGTKGYVQMRNETGDVLRLTNVLAENEGHYKCEAKNTAGSAEHIVQLEVEESPVIEDSDPYLSKIEGSTVDLPCRILKGKPEPSIEWFFMKKGTRGYVQMRNETGDVLHLTNVLADNEGHYKCEAKNTAGRDEHIVQLEVEVSPIIKDSEPYLKTTEGSTVDIPCRIQKGQPAPSITWFFMKKGTKGYVQMRNETGDVLRLTNVLADNEGHYKCEAKNTAGSAEHMVELEVEVLPEIENSELYLIGRRGSTVDLPCRIRKGKPKPSITWFFMKKGTTDFVQMKNETGDVLHLTNVLRGNEGIYTCVAENTVGRAEHLVQLEVEGERVIISLYGGNPNTHNLDELRYQLFARAATKTSFNLARLPPTRDCSISLLADIPSGTGVIGSHTEPSLLGVDIHATRPQPQNDDQRCSPTTPLADDFLRLHEGLWECVQVQEGRIKMLLSL